MVSIYQVDPNKLIEKVAEELKKLSAVEAPEWAMFVKTGAHKERAPVNPDWWYVRAAAVLRSVYNLGPIGVAKLRTKYGGAKNRGVRPDKFVKGSGNIIRKILQQLETEGLLVKNNDDVKKGRIIAPKGQSLLDKCATMIVSESQATEAPAKEAKKAPAKKAPAKKATKKAEEKEAVKETKEE